MAQAEGVDPLTEAGHGDDEPRPLVDGRLPVDACGNAMETMDLDESDLHDGVEVVSSGVGELTGLRDDGYAYARP